MDSLSLFSIKMSPVSKFVVGEAKVSFSKAKCRNIKTMINFIAPYSREALSGIILENVQFVCGPLESEHILDTSLDVLSSSCVLLIAEANDSGAAADG